MRKEQIAVRFFLIDQESSIASVIAHYAFANQRIFSVHAASIDGQLQVYK